MANAAAGVQVSKNSVTGRFDFTVKSSSTVYVNTFCMIGLSTNGTSSNRGYVIRAADTTQYGFLGLLLPDGIDNDDQIDGNGTTTGAFDIGGVILENIDVTSAASIADVTAPCYIADDQTLKLAATSNLSAVGRLYKYTSATQQHVRLFSFEEYMNLVESGKV
jgi:hypothetical protein